MNKIPIPCPNCGKNTFWGVKIEVKEDGTIQKRGGICVLCGHVNPSDQLKKMMGISHQNPQKAIEGIKSLLKIKRLDWTDKYLCVNMLAIIYKELQEYEKAIKYYTLAPGIVKKGNVEIKKGIDDLLKKRDDDIVKSRLEMQRGLRDFYERSYRHLEIGKCYYSLNKYDKAIYWAKRGLKSNIYYKDEIEQLIEKLSFYRLISLSYGMKNDEKRALFYINKSMKLFREKEIYLKYSEEKISENKNNIAKLDLLFLEFFKCLLQKLLIYFHNVASSKYLKFNEAKTTYIIIEKTFNNLEQMVENDEILEGLNERFLRAKIYFLVISKKLDQLKEYINSCELDIYSTIDYLFNYFMNYTIDPPPTLLYDHLEKYLSRLIVEIFKDYNVSLSHEGIIYPIVISMSNIGEDKKKIIEVEEEYLKYYPDDDEIRSWLRSDLAEVEQEKKKIVVFENKHINNNDQLLTDYAREVRSLRTKCNEIVRRNGEENIFRSSSKTEEASILLGNLVSNEDDFAKFIDQLYFWFYESSGNFKRIPDEFKIDSNFIGFDIKHLRTWFRHDIEHNGKRSKDLKIGDIYKKYCGERVLGENEIWKYQKFQLNVLGSLLAFKKELFDCLRTR
ncbi:hypothetical protein ISS37_03310 [candidate division KSB1 bacterium]|nr:hypothetical protein [candidate division KSB1 bacterium]